MVRIIFSNFSLDYLYFFLISTFNILRSIFIFFYLLLVEILPTTFFIIIYSGSQTEKKESFINIRSDNNYNIVTKDTENLDKV